jgi:hypothetical protein
MTINMASAIRIGFATSALCFYLPNAAEATSIVANFAGVNLSQTGPLVGYDYAPPDTDGAIGNNHFVEFVNGGYQVFNRNGTTASALVSDSTFWLNAGISPSLVAQSLSDTRIKFDARSQRWFATEITIDGGGGCCQNNSVLLAVSKSANPLDGWNATSYNVAGSGRFNDYPTLGVDANAVYIGTNDFNAAGNAFIGVTFTSIPKSSLLASTPTTSGMATFSQGNAAMGFTPQGVTNDGTGYTGTKIVAISATNFNQMQITPVNNTGGAGATLGATVTTNIAFDSSPTLARQPDGSRVLDGLDDRFSGTIYQVGNLIYAANAINNQAAGGGGGDTDAVHWLVINATTNAVIQEGLITDGGHDLWQPSIAANAFGDVVIGFNMSGSDLNVSSYAVVGHTVGGVLTFDAPLLLKTSSVDDYTDGFGFPYSRWGDFSTTMVDPTNSKIFWTIQELPFSSTEWGTQISAINLGGVPEPTSWALMLGGFGFVGAALRRRRATARISFGL